jgi:hypothetical protein
MMLSVGLMSSLFVCVLSAAPQTPATPATGAWPLRVQVVDANGDAVADATIELTLAPDGPGTVARSAADGTWQTSIAAPSCRVRAFHAECGRSVALLCRPDPQTSEPMRLVLLRPVLVRGLAISGDGKPWAGVEVQLAATSGLKVNAPVVSQPIVVTDARGEFEFEAAAAMMLQVAVLQDGYHQAPLTVAAEGARIVLVRRGGFVVHGRVVDAAGRELPAIVRLERADADASSSSSFVLPGDPASTFAFEPTEIGRHRLYVAAPGLAPKVVDVELSLDSPRHEIAVALAPGEATAGLVVGATEGSVIATALDDRQCHTAATIGADGAFAFSLPAGTRWRLSGPDGVERVVAAGERGVRLEPSTATESEVAERPLRIDVFLADGKPAFLSQVRWVESDEEDFVSVATDGNRIRSELPWPRVGNAAARTLVVSDFKAGQAAALVVKPDHPAEQRLQLSPPTTIAVTVMRNGKPARGLAVEVVDCSDRETAAVRDGRATVPVFPGKTLILVRRGRETLASQEVEVATNGGGVTIELPQ